MNNLVRLVRSITPWSNSTKRIEHLENISRELLRREIPFGETAASFIVPDIGVMVVVAVDTSEWMVKGQNLQVSDLETGNTVYVEVDTIQNLNSVIFKVRHISGYNIGDTVSFGAKITAGVPANDVFGLINSSVGLGWVKNGNDISPSNKTGTIVVTFTNGTVSRSRQITAIFDGDSFIDVDPFSAVENGIHCSVLGSGTNSVTLTFIDQTTGLVKQHTLFAIIPVSSFWEVRTSFVIPSAGTSITVDLNGTEGMVKGQRLQIVDVDTGNSVYVEVDSITSSSAVFVVKQIEGYAVGSTVPALTKIFIGVPAKEFFGTITSTVGSGWTRSAEGSLTPSSPTGTVTASFSDGGTSRSRTVTVSALGSGGNLTTSPSPIAAVENGITCVVSGNGTNAMTLTFTDNATGLVRQHTLFILASVAGSQGPQGIQGLQGAGLLFVGGYSPSVNYVVSALYQPIVSYNGGLYKAVTNSLGSIPNTGQNSSTWEYLGVFAYEPSAPTAVQATGRIDGILVEWTDAPDSAYTIILKSTDNGITFNEVASVCKGVQRYLDTETEIVANNQYIYELKSVDYFGVISPTSEEFGPVQRLGNGASYKISGALLSSTSDYKTLSVTLPTSPYRSIRLYADSTYLTGNIYIEVSGQSKQNGTVEAFVNLDVDTSSPVLTPGSGLRQIRFRFPLTAQGGPTSVNIHTVLDNGLMNSATLVNL